MKVSAAATLAAILFMPAPQSSEPVILAAVHFYPGHTVGAKNLPTGLLESSDRGVTWKPLAWPELIASSIDVDPSGRWIYLACGNGVMVSRDGGSHWKLTGGWQMAEAGRVHVDPADPGKAWAATAYGLFHTEDVFAEGNPWVTVSSGEAFRFCSDVLEDRSRHRIIVGAETGIFLSDDLGQSFHSAGPKTAVRRLWQDESRVLAATDGAGLLESPDGGSSWIELPGLPAVCSTAEYREGVLYCGSSEGVHVSRDGGKTWTSGPIGPVSDICFHGTAGTVLAAGRSGIHESADSGATWKLLALEGAIIGDLWSGTLKRSPDEAPSSAPGRIVLPSSGVRRPDAESTPGFADRQKEVRDYFGECAKDPARVDYFVAISAAREGRANEATWSKLRSQLADPGHSMFFSLPAMALYLYGGDRLPPDVRADLERDLTENPIYRGDTENHWVMHYAVLLLAAQTWPQTPASKWYSGQSTQEIYDEARGWLLHWARLTSRRGQGEFDSPTYLFMYAAPMLLLSDFAREPAIQRLASMMVDLLMADYFAESLKGAWCGGHSRVSEAEVLVGADNAVTGYHYLFAGGIARPRNFHSWMVPACYSSYRPTLPLAAIANRRDAPYVHTEVKRVRNVIRHGAELNPPVYKYTYMTPDYAMGSLQGGILQPIQQHTWDVKWSSTAPNPALFAVHPFVSADELAMFFSEDPHRLVDVVGAGKPVYLSPDKWVSSSPHEKVFQSENVLLALYQVPPGVTFPHLNLHFPDCLQRSDEAGWIFGRDGAFFVALFPCQPGEWSPVEGGRRFRCAGARAGFVVVAGSERSGPFEDFRSRILRGPKPGLRDEGEGLALAFEDGGGTGYRLEWKGGAGFKDGRPVAFPAKRLFDGPFISGDVDSGVIVLTDGKAEQLLDFNQLEAGRGATWLLPAGFLLIAGFAAARRLRKAPR